MTNERFDRDDANSQLNNTIMKIMTDELPALKEKIKKLCEEAKRAKYLVYIFSGALFAVGLFFLMIALYLGLSAADGVEEWKNVIEILGFGSASVTSFISVLLIHPIKKIQEANSDASQAEMVYYSWELAVLLYIRAMDITDRDSIKESAEKIEEMTATFIGLLERYYEIEPE